MRADCSESGCVYWARLGKGADEHMQCALGYFGLVGTDGDRLSRWLLEFKLNNRAKLSVEDYSCFVESGGTPQG